MATAARQQAIKNGREEGRETGRTQKVPWIRDVRFQVSGI